MNMFKLIALIVGNKVKEAAGWVQDNITLSMRLLYVSIVGPGLVMVAGVALGTYAYGRDWALGLTLAKACMLAAGVLYGLLSTLFWMRATILIHLVSLTTKAVSKFTDKVGTLGTEEAEKFVRWLRNVTAWATAICIYAALIPFWHSLTAAAVAVICIIFFSAVYSSRWFDSPLLRRVTTLLAVAIFGIATLAMINPRFAAAIGRLVDSSADRLTDTNERYQTLSKVSAKADKDATEIDQVLLQKFTDRLNALRKRAVELCGGRFCSAEEAAEYRRLEQDIGKVRDGSYWSEQIKAVPASSGQVIRSSQDNGSEAELPPPAPSRRRLPKPALGQTETDDIFQELDKYPDL